MSEPFPQYTPAPPAPPGPPAQRPTETMAILGLVFAFVFPPVGLVLSLIGLKQVKQNGTSGRGLALAGAIISALSIVVTVLVLIFTLVVGAAAVSSLDEAIAEAEASASEAPALSDPPLGAPEDAGLDGLDDPSTAFLTTLEMAVPDLYGSVAGNDLVVMGQSACDAMTGGATAVEAAMALMDQGVSDTDAGVVVGAAGSTLCPQHLAQLEELVGG